MKTDFSLSSGWTKIIGDELEGVLGLNSGQLTGLLKDARKNPEKYSVSKLYVMSAMFELIKEKSPKLLELVVKKLKDADGDSSLLHEIKKYEQMKAKRNTKK